jgi:hypothetical protein
MEKTSYEKSKASVEDIIAEYFANKKKGINDSNFTCTRQERKTDETK